MYRFVSKKLLEWYDKDKRDLPWKKNKNPYSIWLSEIILQQTRVEQGLPYYLKFISTYPTVQDLAEAHQDEVLKLWEGLGYYSRARNLHFAAQQVMNDFQGIFPTKYEDLIKLKGVGTYTASAIASFSSNEKRAVVDGNVYRFLSRLFGIATPIDTTTGKKDFQQLADELITETKRVDIHNQAIMDFGATVCQPRKPSCGSCIFQEACVAYNRDIVYDFPIKSKSIKRRDRYFYYMLIEDEQHILIRKRTNKDIWQNLFEFPLIESPKAIKSQKVLAEKVMDVVDADYVIETPQPIKHILSHQTIFASFLSIPLNINTLRQMEHFKMIKKEELDSFAFPIVVRNYLNTRKNRVN